MSEKSNQKEGPEGDPKRGDAMLKRMLKTPPKQHKDMKKGKAPGATPQAPGKESGLKRRKP